MKKIIRISDLILSLMCTVLMTFVVFAERSLPDEVSFCDNDIRFHDIFTLSYPIGKKTVTTSAGGNDDCYCESEIRLLNTIPVKNVRVNKTERRYVLPGGELIGIRLNTEGVIVSETEGFSSHGKQTDPAKNAGIIAGDVIVSADGKKIVNNTQFSEIVGNSEGKKIDIVLFRGNKKITAELKPEISDISGKYKCGLWIRDCTSGIGTLTYTDPSHSALGTLGHGIYEQKTKAILPAFNGELYNAKITGIKRGKNGEAGEIRGTIGENKIGDLYINCDMGIYGLSLPYRSTSPLIPVANPSEIKTGKASIISSVQNGEKRFYDAVIEKIDYSNRNSNKNMVIRITDKKLLDLTGGIVQGMSGSPVIQNGMLVGAVTHVFLNDPKKGYAVFADNMLQISDSVSQAEAA